MFAKGPPPIEQLNHKGLQSDALGNTQQDSNLTLAQQYHFTLLDVGCAPPIIYRWTSVSYA